MSKYVRDITIFFHQKSVFLKKKTLMKIYDEIVEFLAAGATSKEIVEFKASDETRERVRALLSAQKNGTATTEELEELEDFLRLEHIMRLTKARAKMYSDA